MDRVINPTDVARAACILCAILQHRCLYPSDREVIPGIERCRVEVGLVVQSSRSFQLRGVDLTRAREDRNFEPEITEIAERVGLGPGIGSKSSMWFAPGRCVYSGWVCGRLGSAIVVRNTKCLE